MSIHMMCLLCPASVLADSIEEVLAWDENHKAHCPGNPVVS